MRLQAKVFIVITILCFISAITLLVLSLNNMIESVWLLIPLTIWLLETIWTFLWCVMTINKLCDKD